MIKNLTPTLAILALCFVSTGAYAQTKTSSLYEKCMDEVDLGAMKNSQWAACAEQEIKRQDITLNTEYNKLRKSLSAEQKEALTKGQRAWLNFRENWCRFEEVSETAPGGIANYNFCILELTGKQIDTIKNHQF